MKGRSSETSGPQPLLTALNVESNVHLIIGSNPLAAARCTKSLDAGAIPIIVAPPNGEMNSSLTHQIQDGRAQWIQREFEDSDLSTLGREEVGGYVDAVFVTLAGNNPQSTYFLITRNAKE